MEPIPMGTLDMASLLLDGTDSLLTQGSGTNLLIKSLNTLQQADVIQYQHISNKIVVFGIDHSRVYQEENGRRGEDIKSALLTVLSHLSTEPTFEQDLKKRLIDIYTEMPSPQPTNIVDPLSNKVDNTVQKLLDSILDLDAPEGMRTKLYEYQKRSIWKMLKRELCPGYILDPSLIPMKDMENNNYFIDYSYPGLGVYRTPTKKWDDVRGGILCEDMGTGKTCICIALILHTRYQFSTPPSPFTRLHSELAPFVPSKINVDDASDLLPQMVLPPLTLIPTLKDLAAASIKIHGIEYRRFEDYISASTFELLEEFPVFYLHTDNVQIRSSRVKSLNPMKIYISSATLVIVPANLIDQWCNEINKHTRDFALKLLVLTSSDKNIPEPKILASHDVVLISQVRFSREYEKGAYAMSQDNKSIFSKEIRKPFIDRKVDYVSLAAYSSVKRLRHLLERLMTRNRPEDIRQSVTLPPLIEKVVRLDLEYFQILSLNSQIALIQANAVLTQREDQDYFFHPSNLKHLRQVIDNLNNGCFWYSGGESYMTLIRGALRLAENVGQEYPPDDMALLNEVIKHLRLALLDPCWSTLVAAQEVGFFCRLPETMQEEALIPSSSLRATPGDNMGVCVMLAKQIKNLRETVRQERVALYNEDHQPISNAPPISEACILSSTSSKLNYVVSQILYHHPGEKCIVFCQNSTAIYYIQEYLTLAKVRCLTYHKQGMKQSERSSNIMTFNTSENVAAIIMDVQHAAFGIDLSSATRVYFVSPVWQTATMRQATLVIRDSFEEAILRRGELDESLDPSMEILGDGNGTGNRRHPHVKSNPVGRRAKNMADDGKFRELISHIGFMPSKQQKYSLLNDYVPIDVEGAIKDLKIPITLHSLSEKDHSETGHSNDGNVQNFSALSIKFKEDDSEAAQDEIMVFNDGSADESKMVKEEPKDEPMEVHEWYEVTDDDKKFKVEDETEEPFKSEYGLIKQEFGVKDDQDIKPTPKSDGWSTSPGLVKRETSYEKEDSFKRVRFG
ncbi:hypothetical protein BG000_003814 [Podila horticola]|nr:hypothetical protein BG000_003814 [Podila horticola]